MAVIQYDTARGPLDTYRAKATFDWKSLKIHLEGEEMVRHQNILWKFIETHPAFKKPHGMVTLDETRRMTVEQILALSNNGMIWYENKNWIHYFMYYYNPDVALKIGVMFEMVPHAILTLGTDKHFQFLKNIINNEFAGCFALTEVAHGTNAKGMKTEAHYDPTSESFILHTSDFEAAKCWASGLGKTATHAIVYAQLITPDGVNHGLHAFIVMVRNPETMLPPPGVIIGDFGEKIGLNGVDNGFLIFNRYPIPREHLLNKKADVTPEGNYVSTLKNQNKRFGASFGTLSAGRVVNTLISTIYTSLAITIAIRYCASRKQFGPNPKEEWPVIEYQAQNGRLIPHLAATYAMKIFSLKFLSHYYEFQNKLFGDDSHETTEATGMEIHALSSATKPLCAWTGRDAIQDCRESCGGHGYLKSARLGILRQDHDANCTYEGENNVLIQQASKWILDQYSNILIGNNISSPLESASFLNHIESTLRLKFNFHTVTETSKPENLLIIMKWIACYYTKKTYKVVRLLKNQGFSDFVTRNDSQLFNARTLTLVYGEYAMIHEFIKNNNDVIYGLNEKRVLNQLCALHAASCIEKRLGDFYAGGFADSFSKMDVLIREVIIKLCRKLVNEAVALVDVLAPPDHIMNSSLGMSDGDIYKHLEEFICKDPQCFERPHWWQKILKPKL